jgi:SAM-dependent methyltransferase
MHVDAKYGQLDADTLLFLQHFDAPAGAKVLEVVANEEFSADILTDNGYQVTAVDLRAFDHFLPHRYNRIQADFLDVELPGNFDAAFSTSAIEHFGLFVYDAPVTDWDYDSKALSKIYRLLKPGGVCWITVPYGKNFVTAKDWRVYDAVTLQERLIKKFLVDKKIFFKSADAVCPDLGGPVPLVAEEAANEYSLGETHPHVTVLLQLRKP